MRIWTPQNIREFRTRFKLSQKALAELVGVQENYIYLLEKGDRRPGKSLALLFDFIERDLKKKKQTIDKVK
jgi:DNA-binding XRE family transcriptional regulator